MNRITVITGDLIDSSKMGDNGVNRAFKALQDSAERQAAWHGRSLQFTRHRGDGWQAVLVRPELALRSSLAFRAALKSEDESYDTYLACSEGEIEAAINEDLNLQIDDVFIKSGRFLEATKSGRLKEAFDITSSLRASKTDTRMIHEGHSGGTTAAFVLADHVSTGWTQFQAATMLLRLQPEPPSDVEIAEMLNKHRQSVSRALHSAGIKPITLALLALEDRGGKQDA